jgi:hypothetical protein
MSIRVGPDLVARLDRTSQEEGMTRSELAKTLMDEGLRMAEHPGIVFRSGPAARRPAIAGGPDVWEVIRLFLQLEEESEDAITRTAELASLAPEQVRLALRYYATYRDEIDDWIRIVDEEAERAQAAWEREQALLRR